MPPQLRRNCPVYLLAKKGLPIEVRIASIDLRPAIPDARYPDTCHYAVLGADGSMPQEGFIPTGQSRLITFTPKKDGVFAVVVDAKLNAYKIEVVNSPFGIKASKEMPFITYLDPGRQFFYVPADIKNFSVFAKIWAGHHPWHARIMVLDPAGNEVKRVEGELAEWTEIPVTVLPGIPPGLWSVQASSIPNALTIYLSDNISTFLCPNPKLALRTTK
jgi:hypothetical protein